MIEDPDVIAIGTYPQWGMFAGIIAGLIGLATVYVRGIPLRTKADSEAKQADNADYSAQIEGFRAEVHQYKNEVMALQGQLRIVEAKLLAAESGSRLRADRITNMTFIIRLLISELRRLDPHSIIVKQAEALLEQMEASGNLAKTAVEIADEAVIRAQETVKATKVVAQAAHKEKDDDAVG